MPRRKSLGEPLPSFVDIEALDGIADTSPNLAMAKKAIEQIEAIEDVLLRGDVTKADFRLAMKETAEFASIVERQAIKAIGKLMQVRGSVRKYRQELKRAIG